MASGYDYVNNGGPPLGVDVTPAGVKVLDKRNGRKIAVFTNASDEPIYLAFTNSPTGVEVQAEVGKGVYLAPAGGAYELNFTNLYPGEVWAIHGGTGNKRLCVHQGS